MDIKYIKDAPNGPAGSTDKVTPFEGNILILTGFAEPVKTKAKRKSKSKTGTDTDDDAKTDTEDE